MATKAVSYLRVSGVGQVDGDGFPRQRAAISRRARAIGAELIDEFADEGVSGTLAISERPGLSALLERVLGNGVRLVLVEKADRLARDLVEGELILREFRRAGVRVIEAEGGNDLTAGDADNPTAKLIRQVLGAVAEFEKAALVGKLRAARARMRREGGRCEGVKPYGSLPGENAVLETIRSMRRGRRGFPDIAAALNAAGHTTRGRRDRPARAWTAADVRHLVRRR